ncbi:MAG: DUF4150 domain-containing protein [Planctomycetota bacterium]|nr:DUF4150 domain-containing protein [Planctomycetota bacterium]
MSRLPAKLPPPDFKMLKPMTELDGVISQMKKAKQDYKELEAASKELNVASHKLTTAYKVSHKIATKERMAIPPDVCKTPSPGGPVPIPYPNIAKSQKATDSKIKIVKKAEAAHQKATLKVSKILDKQVVMMKSKLASSSGDEAGQLKGIISSSKKGKVAMKAMTTKVKVEGKSFQSHINTTRNFVEKQIKSIEKKKK